MGQRAPPTVVDAAVELRTGRILPLLVAAAIPGLRASSPLAD